MNMNVDNSSISMDDLVAALSSSAHIGQEALDIQALHNQLTQTLHMAPSFPTPVGTAGRPRTCTTPIASTSTSSAFACASAISTAMASSSSYSRPRMHSADADVPMHEDFEDELAVECMLASPRTPVHEFTNDPMSMSMSASSSRPTMTNAFAPLSPESSFAREDPFFRSVTLQPSAPAMQQSIFAQAARPSSSSPFYAPPPSQSTTSFGSVPQGGFGGPAMASFAPAHAQAYVHMSPFGA